MKTAWVQLGRAGDVLNILPLIWHDAMLGNEPTLIVSAPFAHAASRCSYLNILEWSGPFERLVPAIEYARQNFDQVYVPQIYAHDFGAEQARTQPSFAMESWASVGMMEHWNRLPLVIDMPLPCTIPLSSPDRKRVLVSLEGHSSPLKNHELLKGELMALENRGYEMVDLSLHPQAALPDLLHAYQQSDVLIASDSAPLHLAYADSGLSVIPLITDRPSRWHGAPNRANHIDRFLYSDAERNLFSVVNSVILAPRRTAPEMIHVWSDYDRSPEVRRRHEMAIKSWEGSPMTRLPISNSSLPKTSKKALRDDRDLPFIKDLIDAACGTAKNGRDIIVLSNDDTCFVAGANRIISEAVGRSGAVYAGRMDFKEVVPEATQWEILSGHFYPGADLFAFSRQWWKDHRDEYPDMVLGAEAWDWIMRELVMQHHGGEIYGTIFHEMHQAFWNQKPNVRSPSNTHNRTLARRWLQDRGIPIRELARTI